MVGLLTHVQGRDGLVGVLDVGLRVVERQNAAQQTARRVVHLHRRDTTGVDVHLRRTFGLADGDVVEIEVGGDSKG